MAANVEIDERGVPYYRFPPFPDTPPGVQIVPFDQFKPSGIVMDMDPDALEVDGLGIRTVRLKAKHNNEGTPVVKKKAKKVKLPTGEQITRRSPWWEEWAEGEDLRSNHFYNAMMPREDRLEKASQDFHKGRNWGTPENGLQAMYDQFRLYIGLIGNPTVPFRKRPRGGPPAVDDEYDSDSGPEDPPEEPINAEPEKTEVGIVEGAKDARAINEKIQSQVEESEMFVLDEKYHQRVQAELEAKEARLEAFLDDPEVAMKIFFSSYFFEKGLAWADQKLRDVPLLASFFLRFMQRNRVLPETSRSLARAIEVVDKAKMELPMTKKITQKLPDYFGKACRELWGEREPANVWLAPLEPYSEDEDSDEEGLRRRQTKRAKIEEVTDANEVASVQVFPEPPQDASMEVDNENLKGTPTDATSNNDTSSAWQASGDQEMSTGWGGSDKDKGGWGILDPPGEDGDTPRDALGQPLDLSGWSDEQPSLLVLFGPTTIPLTHRVGIAELSTRKIVSWSMPPQPVPSGLVGCLRGVLAEVVLAPWDEYSEAKGASVVAPCLVSPDGEEVITTHNPSTDMIRVLMHPTAAAVLHAGMGIQGLWVQAVPRVVRDSESKCGTNESASGSRGKGRGGDGGNGAHNGRGGKKGRVGGRRYWSFLVHGESPTRGSVLLDRGCMMKCTQNFLFGF
ncbi:hypothetical protein BD410DRAFT_780545 [Rickenella mellea]|uniref:Uncharacterized protein n=1 Tax=Rickenella mellea TaxID=50990 RepID=A0A4R5XGV5_9AGAM|nr:hypothetical protein BD410DRAFT_780545 [Rickenella mellea]